MNETKNSKLLNSPSEIKSKWPLLLIGALILLVSCLVPIAIGKWPFGDSKEVLAGFIISKVIAGLFLVGVLVQVSLLRTARGILYSTIILALIFQIIPFTVRLFGFAKNSSHLTIWIIVYLILVSAIVMGIYIPLLIMNKRMLNSDTKYQAKTQDLSNHYEEDKSNSRDNYSERF